MDPTLLVAVATGLTLAVGALAAKYHSQYGSAIQVMGEAAQFVGSVSDVLTEIQKALADETVTPDEIKAISAKLAKFEPLLKEIQKMLVK
jgi:hypothetical protein